MPRRSRMYISGLPYHLVQRGNNREACFFEPEDYQFYIFLLEEVLPKYGVHLHAYVLMINHVHLLLTPDHEDSVSRLTRTLGSRFAQYMNKKYKRTGSLWEGRHKASAVDSENYLLKCYRYIELNPVVASMVKRPEEYRWSSFGVNEWNDDSTIVEPHQEYLKLSESADQRCYVYRELFKTHLSENDLHSIRQAAHYCQPLGNDRFRLQLERKLGRPVGQLGRGRPKK